MTERCLLTSLPTSVTFHVLHEWLTLRSLKTFDSACCNRSTRQELHQVIRSDELRLYQSVIVSDETSSYLTGSMASLSASSRSIIIEEGLFEQDEHFSAVMRYVQAHGPFVRAVTICNLSPECFTVINAVAASCCFLTSVTHEISSVLTLVPILSANPHLEVLSMEVELNEVELVVNKGFSFKDVYLPKLHTLHCRSLCGVGDFVRVGNCITRLDMSGSRMTTAEYTQLAGMLPQLRALCVASSTINDGALDVVTRHCPHIMHLDMYFCDAVTDVGMESVVKNLPKLESLCFEGCSALTWQSLVHIYTHAAKNLHTLHMSSLITESVLDEIHHHHRILDTLFERCQNIHTLGWFEVSIYGVEYVLPRHVRNLKILKLGHSAICDANLVAISNHCPHLTHISMRLYGELRDVVYSDTGLKKLVFGCPQLRLLEVSIDNMANAVDHPFTDLAMDLWRFVRPELKINDTCGVDACFVFDALAMSI